MYDLDDNNYTPIDTIQLFDEVLQEYKHEQPDFIGSKLIYASSEQLNNAVNLTNRFPD